MDCMIGIPRIEAQLVSRSRGRHQSGNVATERMEREDRLGLLRWVELALVEGDSPADGSGARWAPWSSDGAPNSAISPSGEHGRADLSPSSSSRLSAAVSRPKSSPLVSGEALSAIGAE